MMGLLQAVALSSWMIVPAAERPTSLVRGGGFERTAGWTLAGAEPVEDGNPGRCLRISGAGGAVQDVLVARREITLTAAVDLRLSDVRPEPGRSGFAYAAVYQTDENGRLLAHRDFVQRVGTQGWQRHAYTFRVHPQADYVSLRCGLFQAAGTADFDNWTLVAGSQSKRLDEVLELPERPARPGMAAILDQPDLPVRGWPSSSAVLAAALENAGLQTQRLSADGLSDPMTFNSSRFDLVVLPTGPTFPAAARMAMIEFLRRGGSLLSTGGYTFNHLVRNVNGRWTDEQELLATQLRQAMAADRSLLPGGGFEEPEKSPWRPSGSGCRIVAESPSEGRHCAQVSIAKGVDSSATFAMELPCQAGRTYRVSGWMRTREVAGQGMAFMAVYQHDSQGKMVDFRDFATARRSTPWQQYCSTFTPDPRAVRLRIPIGLYQAQGTAWFDDLRLADITALGFRPMNTATGRPEDGLEVSPAQLGIFDPSFPLRRACALTAAPGQYIVSGPLDLRGRFDGWAASGVIGSNRARWIPLVEATDRYGRPRGAAGAMVINYQGFYSGSCWAYFGVDNVDLFTDPDSAACRALAEVARFLVRKTFLRNLATDHRFYRRGEPVKATVTVDNRGGLAQQGEVRFALRAGGSRAAPDIQAKPVRVGPGESVTVEAGFDPQEGDLFEVTATLALDGRPTDQMVSGFVREDSAVVRSGPALRFAGNYFTLDGRPLFLFGSDTYASIYQSAGENPLTWSEEVSTGRDFGMNLYENLQYARPGYRMDDGDWRDFHALGQLAQKHRQVFMPGMLIGQNVAIGGTTLAEQSALCSEYARQFRHTPALLYYVNGDYQLNPAEHPERVKALWNEWLEVRYGTLERLRGAWGAEVVRGPLGSIDFPPPNSGRWDDRAAADRFGFLNGLMVRWNQAHVQAVRGHDREHPITSEYYSTPFGGIDLVSTIDGQDVANIGFFERPTFDLDELPLRIRWNDLRMRGKGVSLGEYGVKTHPAWAPSNGGAGYHIQRTEEQQKQLFLMVGHYALGLGASKVQNWCLRDAQDRVFPWGIFYPNGLVPKDVACIHRNQSLVWRYFAPAWRPPALAVCLANRLRRGNQDSLGAAVACRAFADLLALHYDFAVIDDDHLDALDPAVKAMILPSPFAMDEPAFGQLLAWVSRGGTLLVTGDLSYDADRRPTGAARLRDLAGVERLAANYPNVQRHAGREIRAEFTLAGLDSLMLRPCLRMRPLSAEVLGKTADGEPVLVRTAVGRGLVYFFSDPIELDGCPPSATARRSLYAAFLRASRLQPLPVEPDAPWLHVMNQATRRGAVHVVVNTKTGPGAETVQLATAAGALRIGTRNRWPAMAAVTDAGKVVAIHAFGRAAVGDRTIVEGTGLQMLLALDGEDLRASRAVVVAPMEPGRVELPPRAGEEIAAAGEFRGGRWTELERLTIDPRKPVLEIDGDRATCLILVCPAQDQPRWAAHLTDAICYPERIEGR